MAEVSVVVRPILGPDVPAVARFLHEHMNSRPGVEAWQALMSPRWSENPPNHGFQLVAETGIVGAYVAVYSSRVVGGAVRQFCNLAAFCVLPEHRTHGLRLYRAILGQRGFEFTDLSPSGNVIKLNERMGFKRLDNATTLVPNLPGRLRPPISLSEDPATIRAALAEPDLAVYADHQDAPAAKHLLVRSDEEYAYLMYRRDRRKRLPVFASPLFVGGSRPLLKSAWRGVAGHLLIKHGLLATLAEHRVLGFVPSPGRTLSQPRPKMYRSKALSAGEIDYLYSELTLLQW